MRCLRWFIQVSVPACLMLALIFVLMAPLALTAQTAEKSVATQSQLAAPQVPQGSQQQSYSLPPDKLAKAIALSRIRNILEITGSIWGLVVLWLLLATRAAAGMEAWAERVAKRRWVQGILFFAVFIVTTTLAGLPLDLIGEHFEHLYGVSVQGWGSWFGDQARNTPGSLDNHGY